jgi:hypothetical protein
VLDIAWHDSELVVGLSGGLIYVGLELLLPVLQHGVLLKGCLNSKDVGGDDLSVPRAAEIDIGPDIADGVVVDELLEEPLGKRVEMGAAVV